MITFQQFLVGKAHRQPARAFRPQKPDHFEIVGFLPLPVGGNRQRTQTGENLFQFGRPVVLTGLKLRTLLPDFIRNFHAFVLQLLQFRQKQLHQ